MVLRRRPLLSLREAVSPEKLRANVEKKRRSAARPRGTFAWRWNGSAYYTRPSLNNGRCPPTYTKNEPSDQCNPTGKTPNAPYEKAVPHTATHDAPGSSWPFKQGDDRNDLPYPDTESERWHDNASPTEREAATVYSAGVPHAWSTAPRGEKPKRDNGSAYRRFNAFLRGQDKEPHEEDVAWTHALNKAAQFEFKKPQIVYRGVTTPENGPMTSEEHREAMLHYYESMVGSAVKMDGLLSTTTNVGTSNTFAKSGFMFEIRTKKGLPLRAASVTHMFAEILLGHGWTYKVVDVERDALVGNSPTPLVILEVDETPLIQPEVEHKAEKS